jgi:hypothetical protein
MYSNRSLLAAYRVYLGYRSQGSASQAPWHGKLVSLQTVMIIEITRFITVSSTHLSRRSLLLCPNRSLSVPTIISPWCLLKIWMISCTHAPCHPTTPKTIGFLRPPLCSFALPVFEKRACSPNRVFSSFPPCHPSLCTLHMHCDPHCVFFLEFSPQTVVP